MAVGLHAQCVYERLKITGLEDVAVTTHDFWAPDASDFTEAWMDAIALEMKTFWNPNWTSASVHCRLKEMRFYDDYNGDGSPGEVDYIKSLNVLGTAGGNMLPPQVACSVTELLGPDSRRHWGRFYLPGVAVSALAADGTYQSTVVTQTVNAMEVVYDAWTTPDYHPIVWVSGPPGFHNQQVAQIRVDDIPDIIRRRRYQSPGARQTRDVS